MALQEIIDKHNREFLQELERKEAMVEDEAAFDQLQEQVSARFNTLIADLPIDYQAQSTRFYYAPISMGQREIEGSVKEVAVLPYLQKSSMFGDQTVDPVYKLIIFNEVDQDDDHQLKLDGKPFAIMGSVEVLPNSDAYKEALDKLEVFDGLLSEVIEAAQSQSAQA